MLPTNPTSNQDLLMLLYQKQMQNNLPQANPLAQLMLLKNQFNFLQLLAGDQLGQTTPEINQQQLLTSMALMNQNPNLNSQAAKSQINYLSNFLTQGRGNGKNQPEGVSSLSDDDRKQLNKQSDLVLKPKKANTSSKSMNIPSFNKSSPENLPIESLGSGGTEYGSISANSKKIKKVNVCGHPERAHYAKNLCNQCYHKHGRTKKPWKCHHEKLYAHGLCQNCYINAYNKKRSQKVKEAPSDGGQNSASIEGEADMLISTISTEEPLTMEDKVAFAGDDTENSKN